MDQWLNRLLNVALLAAALAVLAVTAPLIKARWQGTTAPTSSAMTGYKPGDHLPVASQLPLAKNDKTLILFLSSSCHFCTESMSFYQRLATSDGHNRGTFRMIAVSPESERVTAAYLDEHQLKVDGVASISPGDIRLNSTPTLLIVDSKGVVLGAWVGKQRTAAEKDIEARLFSAKAS